MSITTVDATVVFAGDSITMGQAGAPNYMQVMAGAFTNAFPISYGVTTATLSTMITALSDQSYDLASHFTNYGSMYNILSVFAGTNDINGSGVSAATTFSRLQTFVETIRAATTATNLKVLLWQTLPYGDGSKQSIIDSYNALVRSATFADWVVGQDSRIYAAGAQSDTTYFVDTIHPNDAGHAILGELGVAALPGLLFGGGGGDSSGGAINVSPFLSRSNFKASQFLPSSFGTPE